MMVTKKAWITTAHQGYCEENMHSNTLSAFFLAAKNGADMIETDARKTSDGVLIANHDPDVVGMDENGNEVKYDVKTTDYETISKVILAKDDPMGIQYVPTLESILKFAYYSGLMVNIDLKEGILDAENIAKLVAKCGMRGRVVYATNGAGYKAINKILKIDPAARFIDTPKNFTSKLLKKVRNYPEKCYAYTADFSDENINKIRENNVMLAAIGLNEKTAPKAFSINPDMMEYPHTSKFFEIEKKLIKESMKNIIK